MESILQALGGILLRAIPTVILLILVHFYLKRMLFRPLEQTLAKRREQTEGAQEDARDSLSRAEEKAAVYELALKEARAEMYREQEETRRRWLDHQGSRVEEARHRTHELIQQASEKIAQETEEAKRELDSSSHILALQITEALVARRAK